MDKQGLPDFESMIDDFMYSGWGDVKREDGKVFVFIHGDWIPVYDWKGRYEFTGARTLVAFARHFFVKGMQTQKEHVQTETTKGEL